MNQIKQAFIQEFNSESKKNQLIRLILYVVCELREKGILDLKNRSVKETITVGIEHKIPTAYFIGSIGYLTGLFNFNVHHEFCYELAERLVLTHDEDEYHDYAYLILAILNSQGLGCIKSEEKAKLYMQRIKDKDRLFSLVVLGA